MYPILRQLLADKKGGIVFTCFGLWHLLYMAVIFLAIAALLLWLLLQGWYSSGGLWYKSYRNVKKQGQCPCFYFTAIDIVPAPAAGRTKWYTPYG